MTMHKFLISTFRRLLKVTLTLDGELQRCDVMSDGYGIYFGLAHAANVVFVAERNLDIDKNLVTPNAPQNAIRLYLQVPGGALLRTPVWYGSKKFDDLHQITFDRQSLYVTSGRYPFLLRQPVWGGSAQALDLASVIPEHLQKRDVRSRDAYHFNSVSVCGDSLLVLAHNWDQPSFALRLSLSKARRGKAQLITCYEDIGSCCHDILAVDGVLWSLDSGGSALVQIDSRSGAKRRFSIKSPAGTPFPRGLAVSGNMLAISYGLKSEERAGRMDGTSMLTFFDPVQERFTQHVALGSHGNTCAILPV